MMNGLVIIHSTLSGKDDPEAARQRIMQQAESALGNSDAVTPVSSEQDVIDCVGKLIQNNTPRVALSGGDGFVSLFANLFFKTRSEMNRDDYNPDILFLPGGTGNAVSYCSQYKDPVQALRDFSCGEYDTEPLNMLDVDTGDRRELAQFVSFGADGEIIEIYSNQKLKGFLGYLLAVFRYAFSRKLYNIFSRNDANYDLEIQRNGETVHTGRHEGGGISAIKYIGYGFRPYPLAEKGKSHIRFVLFGALLMPTIFNLTTWTFLNRPNRFIYDQEVAETADLVFSFDRKLHVQVSGDLWEKQQQVRVKYSRDYAFSMVKKKNA